MAPRVTPAAEATSSIVALETPFSKKTRSAALRMFWRVSSASAFVLRMLPPMERPAVNRRASSLSFRRGCRCLGLLGLHMHVLRSKNLHHEDEEDGDEEDREDRRRDHAAHDAGADGALAARACAGGNCQRQNTQGKGKRGHQDWPEAQMRRF